MSDRENLRLDFLKTAGLGDAVRARLPGDASTRRYERLTPATGPTLMLMDQAPAAESPPCDPSWTPDQRRASGWNAVARLSAGRIEAFAAVAAHLKSLGLSAPKYRRWTPQRPGRAGGFRRRPVRPRDRGRRRRDAAVSGRHRGPGDAARRWKPTRSPARSAGDWPLLTYDETALQGGADLFVEWLPRLDDRVSFDASAIADWRAAWAPIVASGAAGLRSWRTATITPRT